MTSAGQEADAVERDVRSAVARWRCATMADELVLSADGRQLAFTASIAADEHSTPRRQVAVLDLTTRSVRWHSDSSVDTHGPVWSPTGDRLAWIADGPAGCAIEVACEPGGNADADAHPALTRSEERLDLAGLQVEYLRFAPSGRSLLVGVADPGAERSDIVGSGTFDDPERAGDWRPELSTGPTGSGWRRAWIVELDGGPARCVSFPGSNVWQADWVDTERVVIIESQGPSESDWYDARLAVLNIAAGTSTVVVDPEDQVAAPAASPSGRYVSAIVGAMSDRGLDSGNLMIVDVETSQRRDVDSAGIDVTDQHWADEHRLVIAGQRGLQTVVAEYDLDTQAMTVIWSSAETCGDHVPRVASSARVVVACVHGYERRPELAVLEPGGERTVLRFDDAATDAASAVGVLKEVEWISTDGERIHGLLVIPEGPGPHPLVVHVHGGPVWAWRNSWAMHYPFTSLLAGRGYAVLHPNMRGSSSRGQKFVLAGLEDMGGQDAADLVTGVASLVGEGLVDPARVGITGNSYGGFMSAWLVATSDVFAASIARSPVTDWVSQHLCSNLPGFDRRCLSGDPLAADSDYRTRSPLYLADAVRTPIMLMAGARDLATPPQQAAMFHRALVERGQPSTLVIYPAEGHGVRDGRAIVDQCTRIVAFFEEQMPPRA